VTTDCAREAEVEAAVDKTVETFGRLDFCCNAAGFNGQKGLTAEQTTENLDHVIAGNMKGVWFCERAQIRQMMMQEERPLTTGLRHKTRGAIVNIGSIHSSRPKVGGSPYVMAKHAVLGLSRQDAHDYGQHGVRVNCVCPGYIKTNIVPREFLESPYIDAAVAKIPMRRIGDPEEVAFLACFLASDRASYVTGAEMVVDGFMSGHY